MLNGFPAADACWPRPEQARCAEGPGAAAGSQLLLIPTGANLNAHEALQAASREMGCRMVIYLEIVYPLGLCPQQEAP